LLVLPNGSQDPTDAPELLEEAVERLDWLEPFEDCEDMLDALLERR
jgi:hypothetical protein